MCTFGWLAANSHKHNESLSGMLASVRRRLDALEPAQIERISKRVEEVNLAPTPAQQADLAKASARTYTRAVARTHCSAGSAAVRAG